jgi:hypothetical protein
LKQTGAIYFFKVDISDLGMTKMKCQYKTPKQNEFNLRMNWSNIEKWRKIAQNWYNSPSIHAKVLCQIKKKLIEEF